MKHSILELLEERDTLTTLIEDISEDIEFMQDKWLHPKKEMDRRTEMQQRFSRIQGKINEILWNK